MSFSIDDIRRGFGSFDEKLKAIDLVPLEIIEI
jgi:hypothetical protein